MCDPEKDRASQGLEVTPEMAQAGAMVLWRSDLGEAASDLAVDVFRAMFRAHVESAQRRGPE